MAISVSISPTGQNSAKHEMSLTSEELLRHVSTVRGHVEWLAQTTGLADSDPSSAELPDDAVGQLRGQGPGPGLGPHRGAVPQAGPQEGLRTPDSGDGDALVLQGRTVVVVGLGRVGSRVAEFLARAGVGTLLLVDRGQVEVRHLESSAFLQEHIGLSKAQAIRQLALEVARRPLQCRAVTADVVSDMHVLVTELFEWRPPDFVVACVDSHGARIAVNDMVLERGVEMLSAKLGHDARAGSIHLVDPGRTACLGCLRAKEAASGDAGPRFGEGDGDGSGGGASRGKQNLPGLPLLFAGILAQNTIKRLQLKPGTGGGGGSGGGVVLPAFKFKHGADRGASHSAAESSSSSSSSPSSSSSAAAAAATTASTSSASFKSTKLHPSKEYQSFGSDPFNKCPNPHCIARQKRIFGSQ